MPTANGDAGGGQSLAQWISERIRDHGPITFAEFMHWALYHPTLGYYSRGPSIGVRGDFVTSPEASSAFGTVLARHISEIDSFLGSPQHFHIIECGPGNGTLAHDLLAALRSKQPDLYTRLTYWLVEISPGLIRVQEQLLGEEFGTVVRWAGSLDELPRSLEGAVLANELVDAFPVHLLTVKGGELLEKYVALSADGDFEFLLREPSDPALVRFMDRNDIKLEENDQIEVNLASETWLASLNGAFGRGIVTLIDYGDTSPGRYSEARRQGTLLAYSGGKVSPDALARPGLQDLTALVDFSALSRAALTAGFSVVGMTRQANFLLGLGLGTGETAVGAQGDLQEALSARRGLQALISPEGLGRFHVLILGKGVDPEDARQKLSGLSFAHI